MGDSGNRGWRPIRGLLMFPGELRWKWLTPPPLFREYPPYPGGTRYVVSNIARERPTRSVGAGQGGFRSPGSWIRGLPVRLINRSGKLPARLRTGLGNGCFGWSLIYINELLLYDNYLIRSPYVEGVQVSGGLPPTKWK